LEDLGIWKLRWRAEALKLLLKSSSCTCSSYSGLEGAVVSPFNGLWILGSAARLKSSS